YYYIDLLKSKDILYYSEFVDSITYIPLETNEECLIGKVKDIRITDSAIFILDEKLNRICMFDKAGQYIGKLDKEGNGPGEYGVLRQFYVHERKDRIYLNDYGARRLLIYDMQGNFKEQISLDFPVEDFVVLQSGNLRFYHTWNRGDVTGFLLADSQGKIKKTLVENDKRFLISLAHRWEFTEVGEGVMFISLYLIILYMSIPGRIL
ncbi:MAG: 6-bladed beta-propeller, partial [Bacteroides sp.]|nr:6-bladed beta-propeller [Bacteroides sp.]